MKQLLPPRKSVRLSFWLSSMFGRSELRSFLDTAPRRVTDLENGLGNLQPRVASFEFHMKDMQKKQEQFEKQLDRMIKVVRGMDDGDESVGGGEGSMPLPSPSVPIPSAPGLEQLAKLTEVTEKQ